MEERREWGCLICIVVLLVEWDDCVWGMWNELGETWFHLWMKVIVGSEGVCCLWGGIEFDCFEQGVWMDEWFVEWPSHWPDMGWMRWFSHHLASSININSWMIVMLCWWMNNLQTSWQTGNLKRMWLREGKPWMKENNRMWSGRTDWRGVVDEIGKTFRTNLLRLDLNGVLLLMCLTWKKWRMDLHQHICGMKCGKNNHTSKTVLWFSIMLSFHIYCVIPFISTMKHIPTWTEVEVLFGRTCSWMRVKSQTTLSNMF